MPFWSKAEGLWLPSRSPVQQEVLWFNDIYPPADARPPGISVPDVWHVVSLAGIVPPGTTHVMLGGLLLITSEGGDVTDTIKVWLCADAADPEDDYVGQATTVATGERQCFNCVVPLNPDLTFRFRWTRTDTGTYPAGPAYGIRLFLQGFAAPADAVLPQGQRAAPGA